VNRPRVISVDATSVTLADDPQGVAHELVLAVLSDLGDRWLREMKSANALKLGPSIRAERVDRGAWKFVRDTGAELVLSLDEVDELASEAWAFKHAFRLEHFPLGATLGAGRFELQEELRGSSDRGQYRGIDHETDLPVLITLGAKQTRSRPDLEYRVPGIAKLLHIGPLSDHAEHTGMVETEPNGAPISSFSSVSPVATALAVARIVALAHAGGHVLGGLRPELVYGYREKTVTGIAPRCEPFLATAARRDGVAPCFDQFFMAPEILSQPDATPTPAADVFSICAMLALWLAGEHPYQGEGVLQAMAISAGQRRALKIPALYGPVLDNGLVPLANRMSLAELIELLQLLL